MDKETLEKLIEKLLALPGVKEEVKETEERAKRENLGKQGKDEGSWIPWTRAQSESQAIYNFMFSSDLASVIAIDEIFLEIQEKISNTIRVILYRQDRFLKECHKINGEELTKDALGELYQLIENRIRRNNEANHAVPT